MTTEIDVMSRFEYLQESINHSDVEEISESIMSNGWIEDESYPVVVVKSGKIYTVVDGHHRVNAAKLATELGWTGYITAIVINQSEYNQIVDNIGCDDLFEIAEEARRMN